MLDKELIDMFWGTLQSTYLERMICIISSGFSDLVIVGEHIESILKTEKLQDALSSQVSEKESSSNKQKEEEDETNIIWEAPQAPSLVPYG